MSGGRRACDYDAMLVSLSLRSIARVRLRCLLAANSIRVPYMLRSAACRLLSLKCCSCQCPGPMISPSSMSWRQRLQLWALNERRCIICGPCTFRTSDCSFRLPNFRGENQLSNESPSCAVGTSHSKEKKITMSGIEGYVAVVML